MIKEGDKAELLVNLYLVEENRETLIITAKEIANFVHLYMSKGTILEATESGKKPKDVLWFGDGTEINVQNKQVKLL